MAEQDKLFDVPVVAKDNRAPEGGHKKQAPRPNQHHAKEKQEVIVRIPDEVKQKPKSFWWQD